MNAIPEGSTVYMDVTHGFRSLPIVTLLALAYLRSVRGVKLAGVLYGAFEAGQAITPVFDLTPFVSLLDWASAAERFIDTGDARKMTRLLAGQPNLEAVAAPLAQLSGALAFQRPVEASRAARALRKQIKKVPLAKLPMEQGQFALALEHIEQRFEGIAHGQDAHHSDPVRVLKGQYRQIQFYVRGGQYAQAVELMYEWLISVRFWGLEESHIWTRTARQKTPPLSRITGKPEWSSYSSVWTEINQLRNRFAHFNEFERNLDEVLTPHRQLENDIQALISRLPAAVRPLGLELD
ncbi:TIGR02221 family CRISPR-associated protein [Deinococcus oregonensis]|uniref:TIGR02221 family CRISPR-associated protein n=1 Tax=Deinococcus oregonensis TaxID=1805970 RepID=A0ABV6AZ18_9DEIO